VLKHARHLLRRKSAGLLVACEAKNARVNSPRCPNVRSWRGRPGLASRWHLAGGREQGQDALATDNSSGVVALTLGTSLCERPAEVVGFLEALGLVADGSFFAYAGDDDLAEKLYLKIGKRLLEELDDASGGLDALILERDGYRRREALYLPPVLGAVEINESVDEGLHQGGRAVPIDGRAEDDYIASDDPFVDFLHIVVLAALPALPTRMTAVTLADEKPAQEQLIHGSAGAGGPFSYFRDQDVGVAVLSWTSHHGQDSLGHRMFLRLK